MGGTVPVVKSADTVCQYCQVAPSEALKKEKVFKLWIFLFTCPLIYVTTREAAQMGSSLLDLGEWQSLCI